MSQSRSRRQLLQTAAATGTTFFVSQTSIHAQSSSASSVSNVDDARARLETMIFGYRLTQMIYVTAKLGIADHLKQGPRTIQDLAKVTQTHEDTLYRLLRTLAGFGIFAEEDGPKFRLTLMGDLLRTDVFNSLHVGAQIAGEWNWPSWGKLMHSIKTGEVAFDHLYGKNMWAWLAENPGPSDLFNGYMTEITARDSRALLGAYDFSKFQRIVDVAGGQGSLLSAILNRNPKARGILFELPHVIESAKKVLDRRVASRIEFVSGDFFKAVPAGGDLYVLKNIIHDWNDSRSRNILDVCRRAVDGRGVLLLIEQVVCEPNKHCSGKMADMQMMVVVGGRNRTEKEYSKLLKSSGFELTRIIASAGPDIIEAASRGRSI